MATPNPAGFGSGVHSRSQRKSDDFGAGVTTIYCVFLCASLNGPPLSSCRISGSPRLWKNEGQRKNMAPPAITTNHATGQPVFFSSAVHFRRWLETNHATMHEVLAGFYRKASGRGGLAHPVALDAPPCLGWTSRLRQPIRPDPHTLRFP